MNKDFITLNKKILKNYNHKCSKKSNYFRTSRKKLFKNYMKTNY